MTPFTQAQADALGRAQDILKEHFTGSLVVVVSDVEGHDHKEATRVMWHGGRVLALGLCEEARDWIINGGQPPDDE